MDLKTAIDQAGGQALVARACTNRGHKVSRVSANQWYHLNKLPFSEWTGKTRIAPVICELAHALGYDVIHPLDICPGAGQYMQQPTDRDA